MHSRSEHRSFVLRAKKKYIYTHMMVANGCKSVRTPMIKANFFDSEENILLDGNRAILSDFGSSVHQRWPGMAEFSGDFVKANGGRYSTMEHTSGW